MEPGEMRDSSGSAAEPATIADGALTPARRRALSVLVALLVATATAGSLWPGQVGDRLHEVGLHQPWGVFAPEPIRREMVFEAVVTFADGTTTMWRPLHSRAPVSLRSHRWELWEDRLVQDEYSPRWEEAARWIVAQHDDGRRPVRVALRRRWSPLPPPGTDPALRMWNEFEFYALDL